MGALTALLLIPYRSFKESIERASKNRKNTKNNIHRSGVKSAPVSRVPSRNSKDVPSKKGIQRSQSLRGVEASGALPVRKQSQAQAQAKPASEQKQIQERKEQSVHVVERDIALEAPIPVSVAATSTPTSASSAKIKNKKQPNTNKMATDEDYMAFLNKANEDPSAGIAPKAKSKHEFKTMDEDVDVPGVLVRATKDAWYVSDADEPFVVVALKLEGGGMPDQETFAKLINHPSPSSAEVQIMDIGDWDPRGQYKSVVDAVRDASKGSDVRVYKVPGEGSRVEYWVVGVHGGRLLGCKALGVES